MAFLVYQIGCSTQMPKNLALLSPYRDREYLATLEVFGDIKNQPCNVWGAHEVPGIEPDVPYARHVDICLYSCIISLTPRQTSIRILKDNFNLALLYCNFVLGSGKL